MKSLTQSVGHGKDRSLLVFLVIALAGLTACSTTKSADAAHDSESSEITRLEQEWQAYDKEHRASFDGRFSDLSYLSWKGTGPTFIWLHGTYSSAYEFVPFAERLQAQGYRVVAVEYCGHGQSPLPDHEISLAHLAHDLAGLCDKLGVKTATVGGWSRGGSLAAEFYLRFPERVSSLVLLDGGSWSFGTFVIEQGEESIRKWLESFHDLETRKPKFPTFESKIELLSHARKYRSDEGFSEVEKTYRDFAALARTEKNTDGRWTWLRPSLLRYLRQDSLDAAFEGMVNLERARLLIRSTSEQNPLELFRTLKVPVLLIDPTADYLDMAGQNRALKDLHPSLIDWRSYAECGHDVMAQKPQEFLRDLLGFLQKTGTSRENP